MTKVTTLDKFDLDTYLLSRIQLNNILQPTIQQICDGFPIIHKIKRIKLIFSLRQK